MKNINWLQVAGVVTVVALVFISLFTLTAFLRKLPNIQTTAIINLLVVVGATIAAIFYISKTNYGISSEKVEDQNK